MSEIDSIRRRIDFARSYTLNLLQDIDDADWYRKPGACPTHVAWQAGHLAMAMYRLGLERIRCILPEDRTLISPEFIAAYARDSTPTDVPGTQPTPVEIRATMARIYQALHDLLDRLDDSALAEPVEPSHAFCTTKGEILDWCAAHEMVHAGQIALLRRALGASPRW